MAWGFFKKIVVADTIANYTGAVFNNPNMFQGFSLALAVGFFPIQIYCDFSGYSDIAIGTAKLMGINLMTNFKSPYYSQSIKEFWSRWHISLSTWFKDYVYIPLGGNRAGKIRHRINLLFTFLVSGLWHGADWTFVIWGGIHGLAQVLESIFVPKKQMTNKGLKRVFKTLVVFCFTTFAWVFFASKSETDSFYIIKGMWAGIDCPITYLYNGFVGIGMNRLTFSALGISILMLFAFDYISLENDVIEMISSKGTIIRWSIYIAFIVWVLFNVPIADTTEFIYFQF